VITVTEEELRGLPVNPSLRQAAEAVGMGRNQAYRAAKAGKFPVPVRADTGTLRVSKFDLLAYLRVPGYYDPPAEPEPKAQTDGPEPEPARQSARAGRDRVR
jgi:hypothetical protein